MTGPSAHGTNSSQMLRRAARTFDPIGRST